MIDSIPEYSFQYRRRYREGYNSSNPMSSQLRIGCFNTEDGIGRATTRVRSRKMAQTSEFQYRRRYREGYNLRERNEDWRKECRFNTEDGIGRATTKTMKSICRAVLPFQYRRRYREGYNYVFSAIELDAERVSIPKTVSGGLQHCAPEPLGLLAPDE